MGVSYFSALNLALPANLILTDDSFFMWQHIHIYIFFFGGGGGGIRKILRIIFLGKINSMMVHETTNDIHFYHL